MRRLNVGAAPAPEPKPTPRPRPAAPQIHEVKPAVVSSADPELLLLACILGDGEYLLFPQARHLPTSAFTSKECAALWGCLLGGLQMPDDVFQLAKASGVAVDRIFEISHMAGLRLGFPQFLEEVEAQHRCREIHRIGAMMANSKGDDPLEWMRQLERIGKGAHRQAQAESLGAYDIVPDGDRSILLGDSYLCRGDGMIFSSTSGMGKSSMAIQKAVCYALGRDFYGLKPNGPLTSLMLQAEDSRGDIGKVRRSIYHSMKLTPEEIKQVEERVLIVSKKGMRGQTFLDELRRLVAKHKPDLVWVNPLQAFMDGDIKDSRDLGNFLRRDLDGVNEDSGFAYILVHHTPKPPTGPNKVGISWSEEMYQIAGGAELINWARAIMNLKATADRGQFNLVLSKRGTEADVTKQVPQGAGFREEVVTTIALRWSDELLEVAGRKKRLKITFWLTRTPDPEETKKKDGPGRPRLHDFATFRTAFQLAPDKAERTNALFRRCQEIGDIGKGAFFLMLDSAVQAGQVIKIAPQGSAPKYHLAKA